MSVSNRYVERLRKLLSVLPNEKYPIAGDRLFELARYGLKHSLREAERWRKKHGHQPRDQDLAATIPPESEEGLPDPDLDPEDPGEPSE